MYQNRFEESSFEDFSSLYEHYFKKRRITNQEVLVEQLSLIQSQDNSTQLPPFQTAFHSSEDQDNSIRKDLKHLSSLCNWLTEEIVIQNQEQLQQLFQEEKRDNGSSDSQDFLCQICRKQYKNKKTFNSHVQTKHNLTRPFSCGMCQKSFKRADYLQKHQDSHKQERDFECSQCEQRFKSRTVLDSHVKTVHRRAICGYCSCCNKGFTRKDYLRKHMQRGQQRFECRLEECSKRFASKQSMERHFSTMHRYQIR